MSAIYFMISLVNVYLCTHCFKFEALNPESQTISKFKYSYVFKRFCLLVIGTLGFVSKPGTRPGGVGVRRTNLDIRIPSFPKAGRMTFLPTYQESFLRYTALDASTHESSVLPVGPVLPVLRVRPVKPKPAKPAWRPDWLTGGRANGLPAKPMEIFDCFDSEIWNS